MGQAVNFRETMHMTSELKPSVVLLDLHRPEKHEFMTTFVNSSFRATANTFSCNGRRSKRASGELRRACAPKPMSLSARNTDGLCHSERGHDVAFASAFTFARRSCVRRDHASASSRLIGRLRTTQTVLKFVAARTAAAIDLPTCDLVRVMSPPLVGLQR